MIRALYTAATGMNAQQMNLDNIANNLANSSTTGFQERRMQFTDLLYQNEVMPGSASTQQTTVAAGLQVGLGVRPGWGEITKHRVRSRPPATLFDIAIQGAGTFKIESPSGQLGYTRAGSFHLDAQGNIVTPDGNPLQPTITIPPDATNVSIGSDGTVTATIPGQTQASSLGIIQLATFPNAGGLNSIGGNMDLPTTASGDAIVGNPGGADGLGTLQQNSLEQSNVSVVEQFVDMIVAQRSYEANSRVVKAADEMMQQLNQLTQ